MKTGYQGTFVISWSQSELDGSWAAPIDHLRVGASWAWTGEPIRVDGANSVLLLGEATGEADIRKRAAQSVRRLLSAAVLPNEKGLDEHLQTPLFEKSFNITDGRGTWTVTVIDLGRSRPPLLMFVGELPPKHREMWVVSHNIDLERPDQISDAPGGVICFTPGTTILTDSGPRQVETLVEGDRVQTKDNGCQEILWIGTRRVTGARLFAMPHYAPVRMAAGALDKDVPDEGLLVSPDHRMVLKGPRAKALFNADEVLVTARDLVNDHNIYVDRSVREVTYIHMLLPSHEVVFANNVETESFHPASAALSHLGEMDRTRLFDRLPELGGNPQAYGAFARRVLTSSDVAILSHDYGRRV